MNAKFGMPEQDDLQTLPAIRNDVPEHKVPLEAIDAISASTKRSVRSRPGRLRPSSGPRMQNGDRPGIRWAKAGS